MFIYRAKRAATRPKKVAEAPVRLAAAFPVAEGVELAPEVCEPEELPSVLEALEAAEEAELAPLEMAEEAELTTLETAEEAELAALLRLLLAPVAALDAEEPAEPEPVLAAPLSGVPDSVL